jgi:hypothetical protein
MIFGSNIEEETYGKGIDIISDRNSSSVVSGRTKPPSRLSGMADMKVHLTCIPRVLLDRSITDVLPFQGKNTCALDIYLVIGRSMLVGLNGCDQMPPSKLSHLVSTRPLAKWIRATISRPWPGKKI